MELVQLSLCLGGRYLTRGLFLEIFGLQIIVVEFSIEVLVVVDPCADHMRVLFSEVSVFWLTMHQHWFIIAVVISGKRLITPQYHLAPQVGVLAAVVHSSVGFKVLLNIKFVFFKCQFDQFGVCVLSKNFVEITTNSVLLIVEPIEVSSTTSVNMLCHQLSQHAPAEFSKCSYLYSLVICCFWVKCEGSLVAQAKRLFTSLKEKFLQQQQAFDIY